MKFDHTLKKMKETIRDTNDVLELSACIAQPDLYLRIYVVVKTTTSLVFTATSTFFNLKEKCRKAVGAYSCCTVVTLDIYKSSQFYLLSIL